VDLLRSIPDGTLGAVSAFHIVETLAAGTTDLFLDEALRALRFEWPHPIGNTEPTEHHGR